jgi:hypothetical protein
MVYIGTGGGLDGWRGVDRLRTVCCGEAAMIEECKKELQRDLQLTIQSAWWWQNKGHQIQYDIMMAVLKLLHYTNRAISDATEINLHSTSHFKSDDGSSMFCRNISKMVRFHMMQAPKNRIYIRY